MTGRSLQEFHTVRAVTFQLILSVAWAGLCKAKFLKYTLHISSPSTLEHITHGGQVLTMLQAYSSTHLHLTVVSLPKSTTPSLSFSRLKLAIDSLL